jgi:23S rRNA (cytidine1920-2'-O)/16S rRNA (cytidine1409-2'-O)-methyltransferase
VASKVRADQRLVELGLAESRSRAQALILAGEVLWGDRPVDKAGAQVSADAELHLRSNPLRYVSRGGLKLEKALAHFGIDPAGLDVLDVGASTGGFTDCLLQHGAARVCALDVGYGQLAWRLRDDARVTALERVNVRHLDPSILPFRPDLVVCDVSFISLTLVLPKLVEASGPGGRPLVVLVKPQFEGREGVEKGGVVRDPAARQAAIDRVLEAARTLGCAVHGLTESPITGPAGNVEYLLHLGSPAA